MNPKHIKTGRTGEELACRFLMKQGFRIIERNYLRKWGEIDIVASKSRVLRFVEVKTVSVSGETKDLVSRETFDQSLALTKGKAKLWSNGIRPEEHVTREKLKRLSRAIQTYLIDHKNDPRLPAGKAGETRFQLDIVTVKLNLKDKTALIGMIENVL